MKAKLEPMRLTVADEEVSRKKHNIDFYFTDPNGYVRNEWDGIIDDGDRSNQEVLTKYAKQIAEESLKELEENKYITQNLLLLLTHLNEINPAISKQESLLAVKEKIIAQLGVLLYSDNISRKDAKAIIESSDFLAILKTLEPQKNNTDYDIVIKNISMAALSNETDVIEFFRSSVTHHPEIAFSLVKKHGFSEPKLTVTTPIYVFNTANPPPTGIKQLEGNPLPDNSENKLNYHIHFPENKPKAVVVWIYGGNTLEDRRRIFHHNNLKDIDKALLNDDIAVAKLNTREADQFGWYENQTMFSEKGHKELHDDIHRFFEILKNHPTTLNEECCVLSDIPIYIIGHSYGGRTAVRHVQLYPQDFDGAISINGGLSFSTLKKHDPQNKQERWSDTDRSTEPKGAHPSKAMQWLPPKSIKMEKPVLVIHNVLDTNANVHCSLSFFRRAKKLDSNLNIYLFEENFNVNENHDVPTGKSNQFKTLVDKITGFTTKSSNADASAGISPEEAVVMMAKYYPKKSQMNRFISHGYWFAQKIPLNERAQSVIDNWDTDYKPILAAVLYVDKLSKLTTEEKIKKIKSDFEKVTTIPESFLQSKAAAYLQNKLEKLIKENLISTSDIQQFAQAGISELNDIILRSIDKLSDSERNNFLVELYSTLPELKEKLLNDKDLATDLSEVSDHTKEQLHSTLINLSKKIESSEEVTAKTVGITKVIGFTNT